MQLLGSANNDRIAALSTENEQLRECLKLLQKEIFEIVNIKSQTLMKRYEAEYGKQPSKDFTAHEIEAMNEDMMNMPYKSHGLTILQGFQRNIESLKEFMA